MEDSDEKQGEARKSFDRAYDRAEKRLRLALAGEQDDPLAELAIFDLTLRSLIRSGTPLSTLHTWFAAIVTDEMRRASSSRLAR